MNVVAVCRNPSCEPPSHGCLGYSVLRFMSASGFLAYTDVKRESRPRGGSAVSTAGEVIALRGFACFIRSVTNASGVACFTLGRVVADGHVVPGDPLTAEISLHRACKLWLRGCM